MNKRITWVDVLKGIAMYTVIIGHIEYAPNILKVFLNPLLITTFFFTAGITFSNKLSFKDFLTKKVKTILLPWFVFGMFNIFLTQIMTFTEQESLSEQIKGLFLQVRGKNDGLWFFTCMFCCLILFYFITKYIKNEWLQFVICALGLAFTLVYDKTGLEPIPWHVHIWGSGVFFMYLGYTYKKYIMGRETEEKFFSKRLFIPTIVVYFCLDIVFQILYPDDTLNMYHGDRFLVFYFVLVFLAVWWAICLSKILENSRLLKYSGQNSLMYFAFHGKPKRILSVIIMKLGLVKESNVFFCTIFTLIEAGVLFALLIIPCEIVNRYMPFLLGKSRK